MNLSMVGTGGIVVVIEFAFKVLNIQVPEGSVLHTLNAAIEVIGYILLVWGQIRRPDTSWFILKK